jgi:hypothetical protein
MFGAWLAAAIATPRYWTIDCQNSDKNCEVYRQNFRFGGFDIIFSLLGCQRVTTKWPKKDPKAPLQKRKNQSSLSKGLGHWPRRRKRPSMMRSTKRLRSLRISFGVDKKRGTLSDFVDPDSGSILKFTKTLTFRTTPLQSRMHLPESPLSRHSRSRFRERSLCHLLQTHTPVWFTPSHSMGPKSLPK